MTRPCRECGKRRKPVGLAPLVRLPDGTVEEICRPCFGDMVEGGPRIGGPAWLWARFSFWARQNGLDAAEGA